MLKYSCLLLLWGLLGSVCAQDLIFHTGFEPGIRITSQGSGTAQLAGTDRSLSGPTDWGDDLVGSPYLNRAEIQYKDRDGNHQSKRRAEIVADPTGSGRGKVLKYWLREVNDKYNGRIQMNLYEGGTGLREYYHRFKMYLPSESFRPLIDHPNGFGFLTIIEIWNDNNWIKYANKPNTFPFRVSINLSQTNASDPNIYLRATSEQEPISGGDWDEVWETISDYALPLDTWLDVEFYLKEGDAKNGRVQIAVTPAGGSKRLAINATGYTHHPEDKNPDGVKYSNPMKMYTSEGSTLGKIRAAGDTLKIYWDDFEFWKDRRIDLSNKQPTAQGNEQQAEEAQYGGGGTVEANHLGYRGAGFYNYSPTGGYVTFSGIDGGKGGEATLGLRYALGKETGRTGELVVNGTTSPLTMAGTGGWDQWSTSYVTVDLEPGSNNTISLRSTGEDLGNLDEITVWEDSRLLCDGDTYTGLDGRWSANYWESDIFEGKVCRVAAQDGSSLYADVDHTAGGWDIALTYNYKDHIQVDDIPAGFTVDGRIETNLTTVDNGLWWAGPKIDIRREGSSGLEGNYENYIIENASLSPDAFHNRLVSEGADYIGTTTHDGATYKHYYDLHMDWSQYWAVRQGYRTAGGVNLRPVLQKWRNHGMRNDYIRNMRMNIEASRNSQGSVVISDFATPLPGQSPPSDEDGRILIRAQSSTGGEEMQLEVAGEIVKMWDDVSVEPNDYSYDGYQGGQIRVIFDDDGGSRDEGTDRNLGINYIRVCGTTIQSDAPGVTRTGCGTDNYRGFAWLYCNGELDFGDPGCDPSGTQKTTNTIDPTDPRKLAEDSYNVYPNPARGQLTVEGQAEYDLEIYDLTGRLILRQLQLSGRAEIELSAVKPGLYLVHLSDRNGGTLSRRIVVE